MIGNWNYGTGRRKSSVARVFIKSGKGDILVNGKPIDQYFSRETSRMIARQPLILTNHASTFDIKVNVSGGGETGQAGAVRHGVTRALIDYDNTLKPTYQKLVLLHVMHVKLNVRRLVYVVHAVVNNLVSVNLTSLKEINRIGVLLIRFFSLFFHTRRTYS